VVFTVGALLSQRAGAILFPQANLKFCAPVVVKILVWIARLISDVALPAVLTTLCASDIYGSSPAIL
jgi:hypothetical protein